jgi:hypothetical protein
VRGTARFAVPRGFVAAIDVPPGDNSLRVEANSVNFDRLPPGRQASSSSATRLTRNLNG